MEFRERIAARHGGILDADVLLRDVRRDLGDVSLSEFLEADLRATTAPERLTNPHGHYRELARKTGKREQLAALESLMDTSRQIHDLSMKSAGKRYVPACALCADGCMADGSYCVCKVGDARREMDARNRAAAETKENVA